MDDQFWSNNISILFEKDRLREFFPNQQMSYIERLNSIARLSIYVSIVLAMYSQALWPFYIGVITLIITYLLYSGYTPKVVDDSDVQITDDMNPWDIDAPPVIENSISALDGRLQKKCTPSTKNNPFMNVTVNEYLDNPTRPEACEFEGVDKIVNDNFNYNLYQDISDVFGTRNSQWHFHTQPSTTIPNDQGGFAEWLYKTPVTCKEDSASCLRYEDVRYGSRPIGYYEGM